MRGNTLMTTNSKAHKVTTGIAGTQGLPLTFFKLPAIPVVTLCALVLVILSAWRPKVASLHTAVSLGDELVWS